MESSAVQLTEQELQKLQIVISHGLRNFKRRGRYYDDHIGDGTVYCESVEYEYIDNNRLIYRLFQKYGPNFMETLQEQFLEYANQQFPDMSFQRDIHPRVINYPSWSVESRERWGVELCCLSSTRGNSQEFNHISHLHEDTCCIYFLNRIISALIYL